jgi:hypothetical protein
VEKDPAYALDPDAGLKYGGTLPDQFVDSRHLPYPPFQPKPFAKLKTCANSPPICSTGLLAACGRQEVE